MENQLFVKDNNGTACTFHIVQSFTFNNNEYLILTDDISDETLQSDAYLFKKTNESDGHEYIIAVTDNEEFEMVERYYDSLLEKKG